MPAPRPRHCPVTPGGTPMYDGTFFPRQTRRGSVRVKRTGWGARCLLHPAPPTSAHSKDAFDSPERPQRARGWRGYDD
eukprot:gene15841-biopygen17214